MFLFLFLFFSMLLQCSFVRLKQEPILIKRSISSEQQLNYVVTFFFSENAKNLGQSDDAKQRKKQRMALSLSLSFNLIKNQFFEISLSFNLIKNRFFFYLSLCIG